MKHTLKVTIFLVMIFIISQLIGLVVINQYVDIESTSESGQTVVNDDAFDVTGMKPPSLTPGEEKMMWIFITAAILMGTVMVLIIIKFKSYRLWKVWFLMSIGICLFVALAQFVTIILRFIGVNGATKLARFTVFGIPVTITGLLTLALVVWLSYEKVFKKNMLAHNFTELFIYGGLAALIVPNLAVEAALVLLIVISLYDMIAVWKTKHMVVMAQFQTQQKMFAGLMMPYSTKTGKISLSNDKPVKLGETKDVKKSKVKSSSKKSRKMTYSDEIRTAILGGGDVAFPLIFSGTVLKKTASFFPPVLITITTALALFLLLTYGKKDRFYPAMPFISAGVFLGVFLSVVVFGYSIFF